MPWYYAHENREPEDWGGACHTPKTVFGVNCGSFFLWNLDKQDVCPVGYCTAHSHLAPESNVELAQDPGDNIARQGTDCVGNYSECTALCESREDRIWIESAPRTGYGLSCSQAIADGTDDCHIGDGG